MFFLFFLRGSCDSARYPDSYDNSLLLVEIPDSVILHYSLRVFIFLLVEVSMTPDSLPCSLPSGAAVGRSAYLSVSALRGVRSRAGVVNNGNGRPQLCKDPARLVSPAKIVKET